MRTPVRPSGPAPRVIARVLPGLERLLVEELGEAIKPENAEVSRGRVIFTPAEAPEDWFVFRQVLVCDTLALLVRHARGRFSGRHGLGELRNKLARTQFNHYLPLVMQFGLPAPRHFRIRPIVTPACQFTFVDVLREARHIFERRLGLEAAPTDDALTIEIECSAADLFVSLELPLAQRNTGKRANLPRSLLGALTYLAHPIPGVTLCDPDCGTGELVGLWEGILGHARAIGFTLARPRRRVAATASRAGETVESETQDFTRLAIASPRSWPIATERLSRVVSALPRIASAPQLAHLLDETARCLAPGGRAVFATKLTDAWRAIVESQPKLDLERTLRVFPEGALLDIFVLTRLPNLPPSHLALTAGDRARASQKLTASTSPIRRHRGRRGKGKVRRKRESIGPTTRDL